MLHCGREPTHQNASGRPGSKSAMATNIQACSQSASSWAHMWQNPSKLWITLGSAEFDRNQPNDAKHSSTMRGQLSPMFLRMGHLVAMTTQTVGRPPERYYKLARHPSRKITPNDPGVRRRCPKVAEPLSQICTKNARGVEIRRKNNSMLSRLVEL